MAARTGAKAAAAAVLPSAPTEQEIADSGQISQWEFSFQPPTRDQVLALLTGHRDIWGIDYVGYADYVQALPQNKKISRKGDGGRKDEVYYENWTLYISVGGRIAMLQQLAEDKDWTVNIVPEPVTPTGVPGYLSMGDENGRIIYREYLEIHDSEGRLLGRKPGTAWVPFSGGSQAAGSNPYEKVETSARGRSIAAWGIGIIPGSGIATVEEIAQIWENKAAVDRGQPAPNLIGRARKPRAELLEEALTISETLRQLKGWDEDKQGEATALFLTKSVGVKDATKLNSDGTMELNWDAVKDGQLQLLINAMTGQIEREKTRQEGIG